MNGRLEGSRTNPFLSLETATHGMSSLRDGSCATADDANTNQAMSMNAIRFILVPRANLEVAPHRWTDFSKGTPLENQPQFSSLRRLIMRC